MSASVAISLSLPGLSYPCAAVLWTVGDVRETRPDLDIRQAWEVLKFAAGEQHPACGITEDLLSYAAEALYGPAPAWRE